MKAETKFDVGDKVYYAKKGWRELGRKKCRTCNGKGRLKIEGKRLYVSCYKCYKGRTITQSEIVYAVGGPVKIEAAYITISHQKHKGKVTKEHSEGYTSKEFGNYLPNMVFGTKKEAKEECDKLNKMITKHSSKRKK